MVFKYGLPLAVWVGVAAAVVRVDVHEEGPGPIAAPGCQEVTAHGAVRSSDADCHPTPLEAAEANATAGRTVRSSFAEASSFASRVMSLRSYLADAKAYGTKALHRRLGHVVDILGTATVVALLVSAILGGAWVAYKFMTDPTTMDPMDVHGAALYYAWREQQRQAEKHGWAPPPSSWQTPRPWPPPPPPQPKPPQHAEEDEAEPLLVQ